MKRVTGREIFGWKKQAFPSWIKNKGWSHYWAKKSCASKFLLVKDNRTTSLDVEQGYGGHCVRYIKDLAEKTIGSSGVGNKVVAHE